MSQSVRRRVRHASLTCLLRRLQRGEALSLPYSRPMPGIGPHCHELRINDGDHAWRYHVASDAVVILDVFPKKTKATPQGTIESCQKRLKAFQQAAAHGE